MENARNKVGFPKVDAMPAGPVPEVMSLLWLGPGLVGMALGKIISKSRKEVNWIEEIFSGRNNGTVLYDLGNESKGIHSYIGRNWSNSGTNHRSSSLYFLQRWGVCGCI
jgi:hypothetical protein